MANLEESLKPLLHLKRSNAYYAEKLNATIGEVKRARKNINDKKKSTELKENLGVIEGERNLETGVDKLTAVADHEVNLYDKEALCKLFNVDGINSRLTRVWFKSHIGGLWTYSALVDYKPSQEQSVHNFKEFLKDYKSDYKPVTKDNLIINNAYESKACLVLSLADFHIGKLDREMVPIETRIREYKKTVQYILLKAYQGYNLDEICFVLGNDLLQTDSIRNQTVKGTDVEASMSWDKSYEIAYELMYDTIQNLKQFCNKLTVVYIAGNHSASNEYYIAKTLEVAFKGDKDIVFQRNTDKYKCFLYGETAVFLNHGDNIQDKLPLTFATMFPKEWGATKYHEILLGHFHHNNEKTYKLHRTQGEANGIRMRILPSLTGTDQFHYDNLFTGAIQAGIGIIYDKNKGKCAEIEYRI